MTVVKVPREIRIGGVVYTIVLCRGLAADRGVDGTCRYHSGRIILDAGMTPSQTNSTLVHELLHALHESIGWLDLPADERPKEADVSAVACGLTEILAKLGIEFDFSDLEVREQEIA